MKREEIKGYINKIYEVLEPIDNNDDLLEVFGELLIDYDLDFLGELVKKGYEPSITSRYLDEEWRYEEGKENAGHIPLSVILEFVEEILNTEDEERTLSFQNYTVRLETNEEMEESEHDEDTNWYIEDKELDKKQLIAFEFEE